MENNSVAKISLLKRELLTLISILEKEKDRFDKIDYATLVDDEAGNIGDEHEIVNALAAMLKAGLQDNFP